MHAVIGSWHLRVPRILREGFTPRMGIAAAFFFFTLTFWLAIANAAPDQVRPCLGETSVLMYPRYDRRGVIIGHDRTCGMPHRGCVNQGSQYLCSPFMMP